MTMEPVAIAEASSAKKPGPTASLAPVTTIGDKDEGWINDGDSPDKDPHSSGSSSGDTPGTDFRSMVRLMGVIVTFIIEAILDLILSVLMLLPLLLPWRVCKIFRTNVFIVTVFTDRPARIAARKAAFAHICGSIFDLLVLPMTLVVLLFPMRSWAVIDLLLNQTEYRSDIRGYFILRIIDYDLSLRVALASNFFNMLVDLPLAVCGLIAMLFPWRTLEVIKGSCHIGTHIPDRAGWKHTMNFQLPKLNLRKEKPKFESSWRRMKSLAAMRKRQKEEKKAEETQPEEEGYFSRMGAQPWSGRLSGTLHSMRVWWFKSFVGALMDLLAVVVTVIAMLIPTRWEPFVREIYHTMVGVKWPRYGYHTQGVEYSFKIAPWERLHHLCYYNAFYAVIDVGALLSGLFTLITMLRAAPLINNLKLDWHNSPRFVNVILPAAVDLGPEYSVWDINGRYVRRGWFRDHPCFRRRSGESDKRTRGLLGYWDGWWHICPMEVTDSALARFGAEEDTIARYTPISESDSEKWEMRKGKDAPWEKTDVGLTVTSSDSYNTLWFGRNGYNFRIRCHCFNQALLFLLDFLLLPLALFTSLTVYRSRSLFIKMKEDGVPDDDELDGEDQVGYRLAFGWKCRKECVRQPLLFVLDVLILPLFLCCCITFWRLPEVIAAFNYFDLGFHREVLSKTHILFLDVFLVVPVLLLLATQYRMKYVWEVHAKRTAGGVDWGTRFETLRQFGMLLCDLLTLFPAVFVFGTYYRRAKLAPFEPRNLHWHLSVWKSAVIVLHDMSLMLAFSLLEIASIRRARPVFEHCYHVGHAFIYGKDAVECDEKMETMRIDIYVHLWLLILDILWSPAILLVGITWYRIKYIGSLTRLDGDFHDDVGHEAVIVLFDIVMYGPMMIFLILTIYRVRPVFREMRRDSCGCVCCSVRDYAMEAARRQARRRRRRQRLRALAGRGGEAGTDDDEDEQQHQQDLAPRQWHNLNREMTAVDQDWAEMVQWNEAPVFDLEPQVRQLIKSNFTGLLQDIPFLLIGIPLLVLVWRLPVVCREWPNTPLARDRRKLIAWQSVLSIRDLLIFPFFLFLLITERAPVLMRQLCARRQARRLQTPPKLSIRDLELVFPEAQQGKCFIRIRARVDEWFVGVVSGSLRLHVAGPGFWSELAKAIGKKYTWVMRSVLPIRLRPRNSDVYEVLDNRLDFSAVIAEPNQPERSDGGNAGRLSAVSGANRLSQVTVASDFEHREGALQPVFGDVRNTGQDPHLDRNVEFMVWLPGSYTHKAQQKALDVMENMDGLEFLLVQIEGKELTGRRPIVLCRAATRVSTLRNLIRSKGGSIPQDEYADDDTVRWCQNAHTPGVIETFGALVLWELGQFGLDQMHVFMSILLLLAPWRWLQLVKYLLEPQEYWPCHVGDEMCEIHQEADLTLRKLRYEMRSVCNNLARNLQQTVDWCGPDGMISVPQELHAYRSKTTAEHKKLLGMMRARLYGVPAAVADSTKAWMEIQDARFYYAVLSCYLACLVSAERISLEEHDIMFDVVKKADISFGAVEERASRAIRDVHKEEWRSAKAKQWERFKEGNILRSCLCCKDAGLMRQIVRSMGRAAFYDYCAIVAFTLILLSMYRIPIVVQTFIHEEGMKPTSVKFKNFCTAQIKGIGRDLYYAINIFFLTLGILLTLVRIPEAFEDVMTKPHSIESLTYVLRWNFYDALNSIAKNFLLLGLLRTWKLIFAAAIQSMLLPPVCLGELLNRTCKFVRIELRCAIATLVFYGMLMVPPITRWVDPPSTASSVWRGVLGAVIFLCIVSVATAGRIHVFHKIPQQEWKASTMRPTWCNVIACGSAVFQPALLSMLLSGLYGESWPLTINCGAAEALMPLGAVLTSFWLILISMLLMVSLTDATPLWVAQIMLSQFFFMPIILMFLGPTFSGCSRSADDGVTEAECVAFAFLFAYVATTQLFSMDSPLVKALPKAAGMGVRYASLYIMGAQLLDLMIAMLPVFLDGASKELPLIFVCLVSLGNVLWTCVYKRAFGYDPCCVPHVTVVRISSQILIAWTAVILLFDFLPGFIWWIGVLLLIAVTAVLVQLTRKKAATDRSVMLKATGITNIIQQLMRFEETLLMRGAIVVGWVESGTRERWRQDLSKAESARVVAHYMLDLEECIQAEQMSTMFLDRREIWRDEMFAVRNIPTLMSLIKELQSTMRTPSTVPVLMTVCSQILRRQDLAPFVLNALVGHQQLLVLMQAAVLALPSWSCLPERGIGAVDMMAHCRQSWAIMEDVLLHFERDSLEVTPYDRRFLLLSPWQGAQKWTSKVLGRMNTRHEMERRDFFLNSDIKNTSEWDDRSGTRIYGPDGKVYTSEPLHITRAGREGGLLDPQVQRGEIRLPNVEQVVQVIEDRERDAPMEVRRVEQQFTGEGRQVDRRSSFLQQPTGFSERDRQSRFSSRLSVQSIDSPDPSDEPSQNGEPAPAANAGMSQAERMRIAAQRGRLETQFDEGFEIAEEALPNRGPIFTTHDARPKNAPSSLMQKGNHPCVNELTLQEVVTNGHGTTHGASTDSSEPSKTHIKEAWAIPEDTVLGKGSDEYTSI